MKKFLPLFLLTPTLANAECTPAPDCADMGYTETSCEGDSIKCPFDTTKLFCVPCDSTFQYACDSEGQIGQGNSCNGKYIGCTCAEGYELSDGNCIISCAYSNTSLPSNCSTADSCSKNGTTYYSATCSECKSGYSLSSGTCSANACSGYYTSKTGCSNYSTCQSGSTTKYKCTGCNSGYTLSSGKCSANSCYGYQPYKTGCSSYTTCTTPSGTQYKCTACNSGYILVNGNECIDEYCYNDFRATYTNTDFDDPSQANGDLGTCPYECTGPTSGVTYGASASVMLGCAI